MMKLCVVSPRIEGKRARLQPACYILKICEHLSALGIDVSVVSDGYPTLPPLDEVGGLKLHRLRHVRLLPLVGNPVLERLIELEDPDIVLWHVGLTSFYHLRLSGKISKPVVAIFTSAIYRFAELLELGWTEWFKDFGFVYTHLLGSVVPGAMASSFMRSPVVKALVVQSAKTRDRLVTLGIGPNKIHIVPPGIDEEWLNFRPSHDTVDEIRSTLGFHASDFVVLYLGSPQRYRGVDTLVRALALAQLDVRGIRLVILSRRESGEFAKEEENLIVLANRLGVEDSVYVKSGFLSKAELIRYVAACNVAAFPFRLVSSGVPIGILEALALGKPVISTFVDCIPEVLADGRGYLAKPGDPVDLAQNLIRAARDQREGRVAEWRSHVVAASWRGTAEQVELILSDSASSST